MTDSDASRKRAIGQLTSVEPERNICMKILSVKCRAGASAGTGLTTLGGIDILEFLPTKCLGLFSI